MKVLVLMKVMMVRRREGDVVCVMVRSPSFLMVNVVVDYIFVRQKLRVGRHRVVLVRQEMCKPPSR